MELKSSEKQLYNPFGSVYCEKNVFGRIAAE